MGAGPSGTARRVAAYRLAFERLEAPYGNPDGDDILARDVAGQIGGRDSQMMERYLRARTAFFDRIVVDAIERGVTQLVNLGAGYDGRAIRYAKPGVKWWEVDRAATQVDKVARLARLNVGAEHIGFVAHDLSDTGLADALLSGGYVADGPGVFICEGVAAYLDDSALERLLREVRVLATVGTRLALSLATTPTSDSHRTFSAKYRAAVAQLGEPAVSSVSAQEATGLLAATGWRPAEISERGRRAGFVVADPVSAPAGSSRPSTTGTVRRFLDRILHVWSPADS